MKGVTSTPTVKPGDLSTIEAMIAELVQMREAERDRAIKSAYQSAIDRLQGLAYRLAQLRPITVGRPPRRWILTEPEPAPTPPPSPPQRNLPLGPASLCVGVPPCPTVPFPHSGTVGHRGEPSLQLL